MSFLGNPTGSTASEKDTTPMDQVILHQVSAYCIWALRLASCIADGALRRTSRMSESFAAEIPYRDNGFAIEYARGLEQRSDMLVARKNLSKSPRIARFSRHVSVEDDGQMVCGAAEASEVLQRVGSKSELKRLLKPE
jgi:hypothetical protein